MISGSILLKSAIVVHNIMTWKSSLIEIHMRIVIIRNFTFPPSFVFPALCLAVFVSFVPIQPQLHSSRLCVSFNRWHQGGMRRAHETILSMSHMRPNFNLSIIQLRAERHFLAYLFLQYLSTCKAIESDHSQVACCPRQVVHCRHPPPPSSNDQYIRLPECILIRLHTNSVLYWTLFSVS